MSDKMAVFLGFPEHYSSVNARELWPMAVCKATLYNKQVRVRIRHLPACRQGADHLRFKEDA